MQFQTSQKERKNEEVALKVHFRPQNCKLKGWIRYVANERANKCCETKFLCVMCAKNRSRACSSHLSFALQQRKERCASFLTLFLCVRSFGSERYTGVGFEFARMERERSRYPTNCKLRSLYSRRKSAFRILAHNISLLLLAPDSRHILASPRRALLFISFYLLTMRTMSSGVAEKGLLERRWLRGQERVRGAGSEICYTKNVENRATKI